MTRLGRTSHSGSQSKLIKLSHNPYKHGELEEVEGRFVKGEEPLVGIGPCIYAQWGTEGRGVITGKDIRTKRAGLGNLILCLFLDCLLVGMAVYHYYVLRMVYARACIRPCFPFPTWPGSATGHLLDRASTNEIYKSVSKYARMYTRSTPIYLSIYLLCTMV